MAALNDEMALAVGRGKPAVAVHGWTLRPAREDLLVYARWALFLDVLFIVVYGACNWITARRTDLMALYFDWELAAPFVPAMVWVYLSLFAIFPLPAFALRCGDLRILGRRLCFATLASAILFLLLPARLGFERHASVPGYELVFGFIHFLDLPHNLAPSLHISWSGLLLYSLHRASAGWGRTLFALWFALICAAVVLVHQHHVLDVAGGVLVAYAAIAAVRDGAARRKPGGRP